MPSSDTAAVTVIMDASMSGWGEHRHPPGGGQGQDGDELTGEFRRLLLKIRNESHACRACAEEAVRTGAWAATASDGHGTTGLAAPAEAAAPAAAAWTKDQATEVEVTALHQMPPNRVPPRASASPSGSWAGDGAGACRSSASASAASRPAARTARGPRAAMKRDPQQGLSSSLSGSAILFPAASVDGPVPRWQDQQRQQLAELKEELARERGVRLALEAQMAAEAKAARSLQNKARALEAALREKDEAQACLASERETLSGRMKALRAVNAQLQREGDRLRARLEMLEAQQQREQQVQAAQHRAAVLSMKQFVQAKLAASSKEGERHQRHMQALQDELTAVAQERDLLRRSLAVSGFLRPPPTTAKGQQGPAAPPPGPLDGDRSALYCLSDSEDEELSLHPLGSPPEPLAGVNDDDHDDEEDEDNGDDGTGCLGRSEEGAEGGKGLGAQAHTAWCAPPQRAA